MKESHACISLEEIDELAQELWSLYYNKYSDGLEKESELFKARWRIQAKIIISQGWRKKEFQ